MSDVKVELQEVKEESDSQASAPAAGDRGDRGAVAAGAGRVAAAVLVVAAAPRSPVASAPARAPRRRRVVQLTSERTAGSGSFSPDGTQIAYASAGEKRRQLGHLAEDRR